MGSLTTWFSWKNPSNLDELPDLFPLAVTSDAFVKTDVVNIYSMILTDVMERSVGIPPEIQPLLWDSCLRSESSAGLITMLATAMSEKKDLFLVYEKNVNVLREATDQEKSQIESDYARQASSPVGVFISFRKYIRSDLVRLYSALEYCTVASLNKAMNLSKAVQFKMSDLRASTSLTDKAEVEAQALKIARSLSNGKDVLLDGKDLIELLKPDLESVKEAIEFLNQKKAFYLRLPQAYIQGIQTTGISSTGEADQKAIERGLKSYFFSIIRPAMESVFGLQLTYKSQDFRQITSGLEALKTFELTSDDLITSEEKRLIIESLFDFETDDQL